MEETLVSPNSTFIYNLQIGLLYVFSSIFFFILQLSFCIIFFLYKEYRQNLCYRIMAVSSLTDCIQLVVHAYGGIIVIFNDSFSFQLEKFFGSILESLTTASFSFAFILALNRLIVFLPKSFKFLTKQREHQLFNFLILLCLLFGLTIQILFCFPYATLRFNRYTWNYLTSRAAGNGIIMWSWLYQFEMYQPIVMLCITFFIYLAIFVLLISQRMMISANGQTNFTCISTNELRLLAQAFPQFVLELSINLFWNFFPGLLNPVLQNCLWIFYNGHKPLIYLALNKPIRRKLLYLWSCRTNSPDNRCGVTAIKIRQMKNDFQPTNQPFEQRSMTMTNLPLKNNFVSENNNGMNLGSKCGSARGNMTTIC